jgi:hypothetical protein
MRRSMIFSSVVWLGCGGDDGTAVSSAGATTAGMTAAASTDDATGPGTDTRSSSGDGSESGDTTPTSGSGPGVSSSSEGEASGPTDATATDTSGESDGEPGGGTIDVTLTGCTIDFGGTVVVSYNGSLGVASVYDDGATLTGSFQFELDGTGAMLLSSQHRVDTGNVVNMVDPAQGTWTNLDADALAGATDRISGTLGVDTWVPSEGQASITFDAVSLLNVTTDEVCTIDGTVEATELYP